MISVVTYGRNDQSGYNPHRRVALSLNCMAEVLTDPADEILFVDYNTPDELPTLPEALADTLTERCRTRLRILRVRADVHDQRFGGVTHLPVVEPVARNVAVRRGNPANRWLLMTNTDMVFLPHHRASLTEVVETLRDGFYVIPRFELPEWVWEDLPRSEPAAAMAVLRELGPALRLNVRTTSHDWLRFDSAGDFQLILRDDFLAIDGLDERMVLGWHVDANLGKRVLLRRGSIESLDRELAGYHCNHLRTWSSYQSSPVANDLHRFVVALEEVELPEQRSSWGLAGTDVEEIDLTPARSGGFAAAILAATNGVAAPPRDIDARDEKWRLEYDSGQVLAFVADAIRTTRKQARIAYLGLNPVLERMLHEFVTALVDESELIVYSGSDSRTHPALEADLVVVDLGVDSTLLEEPLADAGGTRAAELRSGLMDVFRALGTVVESERQRIGAGTHARPFVLVNSSAIYWDAFCRSHMHVGPTTPQSGVRRATVKATCDADAAPEAALRRARQLRRWITRLDSTAPHLALRMDQKLAVESLEEYDGFGRGWNFPDRHGVSTAGPRAELFLSLPRSREDHDLSLGFEPCPDESRPSAAMQAIVSSATGDDIELQSELASSSEKLRWEIRIPRGMCTEGIVKLVLALGDGWEALRLRSIELRPRDRSARQAVRSLSHRRRGRTTPRH